MSIPRAHAPSRRSAAVARGRAPGCATRFALSLAGALGLAAFVALAAAPAALAAPSLAVSDYTAIEGDSGTTSAAFAVTLFEPSAQPVTVDFSTADGTATAPGDYRPSNGRLTFLPGETSKTVVVAVSGDTTVELDETFAVNLSNPAGAAIADGQGLGAILNDDPPEVPAGPLIEFAGRPGLARTDRVRFRLRCSRTADGRCRGRASVSAGSAGRSGRLRASRAGAAASAGFSIAPGASATVTVRLSRAARERLERRGRVRVRISVRARDSAGRSAEVSRAVTLRARSAPRFTG